MNDPNLRAALIAAITKAAPQPDSSGRFARIIAEQFGTTRKAAPIPHAISQAALKNNIAPERLLAALHDIAGEN